MKTAAQVLELSAQLSSPVAKKMAHALGWPSPAACHKQRPGRVKWANPYRNGYAGSAGDPDWLEAEQLGLAEVVARPNGDSPYTYWSVTELGKRVLRLRLQAALWAAQVHP